MTVYKIMLSTFLQEVRIYKKKFIFFDIKVKNKEEQRNILSNAYNVFIMEIETNE